MRVGIVGAGLNSEYHINFSRSFPGAQIVAVADADLERARERAAQYGIPGAYGSVRELLEQGAPDVVHVVTPPKTHFAVVREVLEAGCHVLVEKPLALDGTEARVLYDLAEERGVQLCPMHNHLFDPCMRRADALVASGAIGRVVNVESYYGLNTNIPAFRDYPKPNVMPWLYGLPGGVYQDFFPHPLYLLLEYTGAARSLSVIQRSNGVLPQGLPDEIRVLVDGARAPGIVTFSFSAEPFLHFVRIYGTRGMVEVDLNMMTTVVHPVSSLPKAAQKLTYNLTDSWQRARSTVANVLQFATGKLKPYHGMRTLIHAFYDAIESRTPPPVSKQKALMVVDTMDSVFERLDYEPLKHETIMPVRLPAPEAKKVLVTGGTGFLGKALVQHLLERGYAVRVLARKLANVEALVAAGAEIFWGDVADPGSFDAAVRGCELVVHLAAGTSGSEKDSRLGTLEGTRNLVDLCLRHKPRKVVYISSCSVYGVADCPRHAVLSERAPLERFPERRGAYSASKQEAERYVAAHLLAAGMPAVILRPGTIYGPGGETYTPMMGFRAGRNYLVIGTGSFQLPVVHVDNLVSAIALCLEREEANGETFNVIDPEPLTKRTYMNDVIRRLDPGARVMYIPYSLLYGVTAFEELAFRLMKRRAPLTRYRLASSQKPVSYDGSRIAARLGWKPVVPLRQALEQLTAADATRAAALAATTPELARSGVQ
jgi:predicted dehydrogenase/nucleoside-diphosphate-sugar epimerase